MIQNIAKRFGSRFLVCIGLLCVVGESIAEKEKKDFPYYEVIGRRDLFKPRVKEIKKEPISEAKKEMEEYADATLIQELRTLLITGIVSVGDDYKVILEEGGKSYYLRVGDEIKGTEILKIHQERVILAYQGKEVELLFERKPRESIPEPGRTIPPRRLGTSRSSRLRSRQPSGVPPPIPAMPPEVLERMEAERMERGGGRR